MNDLDHDAFKRAIELMQAEPAGSHGRELIEALLAKQQSFEETGETACYYCQCKALRLQPWQSPPMYAAPRTDGHDDGSQGWKAAEMLAYRLRAAGLSKFEPDPLGALERAEHAGAA
jgi:hypothetical protein